MIIWSRQTWLRAIFASLIFQGSIVAKNPLSALENESQQIIQNTNPAAVGTETGLELEEASAPKGTMPLYPDKTFRSIYDAILQHHKLEPEKAERIAREVTELFVLMRKEGRRLETSLDSEDFETDLETGRLKLPLKHGGIEELNKRVSAMGRAKVTKVDGVKWIRVVHRDLPYAFTFYNMDKVEMDSAHIHLIHANNHFNSGKNVKPEELPEEWMRQKRARGALFGRDEIASLYHERHGDPEAPPVIESVQIFLRPQKGTPQYDYEFKLACDKPFSISNMIVNGAFMGMFQLGVLYGINQASPHIPFLGGHMDPLHPALLGFTFAYSLYAGGWLYPKLRARSQSLTYSARFWLRGLLISLPYAVVYKTFVTWDAMHESIAEGYGPMIAFFLAQAVNIGINFAINNRVSNELNEWTQTDQEFRTQNGNVKLLEKIGLKVKRIDFMGQKRYVLISFSARTVDLNNNFRGIEIPLPLLDSHYFLSVGKILYLGLAPLLRFMNLKRVERHPEYRDTTFAQQHRERWDKSFTARMLKAAKGAIPRMGSWCKSTVQSLGRSMPRTRDPDDFGGFLN